MTELDELLALANDTVYKTNEVGPRKYRTLELLGIPETKQEDLDCYALTLSIMISADYTSIAKLKRVNSTDAKGVVTRPVVMEFITIMAKERFLRQFRRHKNHISAQELLLKLPPVILKLVTHNTDDALKLYRSCELFAERYGYQMVWLRNGNSFVQRSLRDKILVVRSQEDLDHYEALEKLARNSKVSS